MSSYSPIERIFAKFLERFPLMRAFIKYIYQRLSFLIYRQRDKIFLNARYNLIDPFKDVKGDTFFWIL